MTVDAVPEMVPDVVPNVVLDGLPADVAGTLDALVAARQRVRAAQAREFALAAHFADLHGHVDATDVVLPGMERLRRFGGDGTPQVAEFATLEFAAVLGMRDVTAAALIASALDVRHRLPWVWGEVMGCRVPVWQAREIGSLVSELDVEGARRIDRELSRQWPGMVFSRVRSLVEGLVLACLPEPVREQRRCQALERRGVWIAQSDAGVADVDAVLDAADAVHLDATVDWLARILAQGGVPGSVDERRAKALGVLATPARALQLQQASLVDQLPDEDPDATWAVCQRDGQPGHVCGTVTVDPEVLLPRAQVVVHVSDESLVDGVGVARSPQLKPVAVEWLTSLLADSRVTVRPVIDQNHQVPSDSYECPPTMREAIQIRNPFECFPWSSRRSAGLDLDHTIPWPAGPAAERWLSLAKPPSDALAPEPAEGWGSEPGTASRDFGTAPELVEGRDALTGSLNSDFKTAPEPVGSRWLSLSKPPADPSLAPEPVEGQPRGGITHPSNLAPLSRKVHRAKTHGGWQVQQPWPGVLLWQSPHGHRFLVTPSRTIDLGRPDPPPRERDHLASARAA